MQIDHQYEDIETDADLPTDNLYEIRCELIRIGYKCFYEPENDAHYWVKRELTTWEKKDFIPLSEKEIIELLKGK